MNIYTYVIFLDFINKNYKQSKENGLNKVGVFIQIKYFLQYSKPYILSIWFFREVNRTPPIKNG